MYYDRTRVDTERLLEQIAHANPDVIWMFTPDWSDLEFVDEAYEEIWGRSIDALVEEPTDFVEGIHPDDRPTVRDQMRRLSDEEPIDVEFRVNADEGYRRHVWAKGEPIYDDGQFVAIAGFVRDVTERKQAEQELERQNERLEEFTSLVSHDLRNPLTVATGRLELAREECESEHLDRIEHAHDRMHELIEDLVSLVETDGSVQNLESVALGEATERCWRNVHTETASLEVDTERTICADPSRLQQLLENLLRNAVEHGGEAVTVRIGDHDDGFYVADDGVGIPENERDRIFRSGYSLRTDGTGLGLHIVDRIVTGHDWTIDVTESADGGTRFEIGDVDVPT